MPIIHLTLSMANRSLGWGAGISLGSAVSTFSQSRVSPNWVHVVLLELRSLKSISPLLVCSRETNHALSFPQIGVWIGGRWFPVYPLQKPLHILKHRAPNSKPPVAGCDLAPQTSPCKWPSKANHSAPKARAECTSVPLMPCACAESTRPPNRSGCNLRASQVRVKCAFHRKWEWLKFESWSYASVSR